MPPHPVPGTISSQIGEQERPPRPAPISRGRRLFFGLMGGLGCALALLSVSYRHGVLDAISEAAVVPARPVAAAHAEQGELEWIVDMLPPAEEEAPSAQESANAAPMGAAELTEQTSEKAKEPQENGTEKPGRTGASEGKPTPKPWRPVVQRPTWVIKGATGDPERAIGICVREHIVPLNLPSGALIKLERSGTLAVVEAPESVHGTGFSACLRQILGQIDHARIPASVTVRMTR